jgi:Protein of unknown function (DUF1822)
MISYQDNKINMNFLLPQVIYLDIEDLNQANAIIKDALTEAQQWQAYLNSLATFSLEKWLSQRILDKNISRNLNKIEDVGILDIGGFKISAIATEQVLDEVVNIPKIAIDNIELASHFYVLLEVSEEEEQVILRGLIRYDQLIDYRNTYNLQPASNNCYQLPLELLDSEPSHLLFYTRYLQPAAIPLPVTAQTTVRENIHEYLQETTTKLSKWLQGIFDDTWQTLDLMLNPEGIALNIRNIDAGTKRGKFINLGMQFGNKAVAFLVSITEEPEEKLCIMVQLHPTGGDRFLPPNISLTLLSKAGKNLQTVEARNQDNYIQLKPFRGEVGKKFSIQVSLENAIICEDFEL